MKQRSFKKLAAILMLVSFIFATVSPAMAGASVWVSTDTEDGSGMYINNGSGNTASGKYSTAMGSHTTSSGDYSTSMGIETTSNGNYSTTMGVASNAVGMSSFAGGGYLYLDISDPDNIVFLPGGKAYGDSSFAFGIGAVAGVEGDAVNYSGTIALGNNAKATHKNSVALGNGSVTSADNTIAVGNETDESTWKRITGVGAGVNATDAVNYGQFKNAYTNASYTGSTLTLTKADGTQTNLTISGGSGLSPDGSEQTSRR